ncbi:MAG: hypothetical protein WA364_25230 [Candidatus Nitrosopolaris sp.]
MDARTGVRIEVHSDKLWVIAVCINCTGKKDYRDKKMEYKFQREIPYPYL